MPNALLLPAGQDTIVGREGARAQNDGSRSAEYITRADSLGVFEQCMLIGVMHQALTRSCITCEAVLVVLLACRRGTAAGAERRS